MIGISAQLRFGADIRCRILLAIAIQNGGKLLAGQGRVGAVGDGRCAVDDLIGICPSDRRFIPIGVQIGKGRFRRDLRFALHPMKKGNQHGAGCRTVGRKIAVPDPVHQALFHRIVYCVIIPRGLFDIAELGFRRFRLHNETVKKENKR